MKRHLAVFSLKETIEQILRGEKIIEARLSRDRTAPFGVVSHSDVILLKSAGGLVHGQVNVENVLFYENLTGEIVGKLRKEYSNDLKADDSFWRSYAQARFATIIFLKKPQRYLTPLKFEKKDRRSWVVLD